MLKKILESNPKFNSQVNRAYLSSVVLQSNLNKVLSYKQNPQIQKISKENNSLNINTNNSKEKENNFTNNLNGIKIEIKERPMLHDNNAFKKRPNTSKSFRHSSLKANDFYRNNNNNNNFCKNKKEIKEKIFSTTKQDPFLHKNFTEIPN